MPEISVMESPDPEPIKLQSELLEERAHSTASTLFLFIFLKLKVVHYITIKHAAACVVNDSPKRFFTL